MFITNFFFLERSKKTKRKFIILATTVEIATTSTTTTKRPKKLKWLMLFERSEQANFFADEKKMKNFLCSKKIYQVWIILIWLKKKFFFCQILVIIFKNFCVRFLGIWKIWNFFLRCCCCSNFIIDQLLPLMDIWTNHIKNHW